MPFLPYPFVKWKLVGWKNFFLENNKRVYPFIRELKLVSCCFKNCSDLSRFENCFIDLKRFFSISRTFFSSSMAEKFSKPNTISWILLNRKLSSNFFQGLPSITNIIPTLIPSGCLRQFETKLMSSWIVKIWPWIF